MVCVEYKETIMYDMCLGWQINKILFPDKTN